MKYLFGSLLVLISLGLFAQDEKEFARPDLPGELMVDIGLNFWDQEPIDIDQRKWQSKSIAFYYLQRKPLSNKFSFYYGLGIGSEKFDIATSDKSYYHFVEFEEQMYLNETTILDPDETGTFEKFKLAVTYLDIPLEIRFHPKGTEDGEGLFVGAGVIGGLRINAHDKLLIEDDGEKNKLKITDDFGLNRFRYGVQFRFGFRGVHFFYKQYLSNQFSETINTATFESEGVLNPSVRFNPTVKTFGINLTGF